MITANDHEMTIKYFFQTHFQINIFYEKSNKKSWVEDSRENDTFFMELIINDAMHG